MGPELYADPTESQRARTYDLDLPYGCQLVRATLTAASAPPTIVSFQWMTEEELCELSGYDPVSHALIFGASITPMRRSSEES